MQLHPAIFIREVLGDKLDENQMAIVEAVSQFDRVAVASCHSIGKTFVTARLALWYLYCFPFSFVLTTAPTDRQVSFLLWGEIAKAWRNARVRLGGKFSPSKNMLSVEDREWYALGFSPQTAGKPEQMADVIEQQKVVFQGWHGDFIMVILDEAVGVTPDVWTQIEGLLTSGKLVKVLALGNPTTKNCKFYNVFYSDIWKSLNIDCFKTQNMIANGLTDMAKLKKRMDSLMELSADDRLHALKNLSLIHI